MQSAAPALLPTSSNRRRPSPALLRDDASSASGRPYGRLSPPEAPPLSTWLSCAHSTFASSFDGHCTPRRRDCILLPFAAWKIRFSGACLTMPTAVGDSPIAGEPTVRQRGLPLR